MALSPGTRLGPYEIAEQIGAGGMGEVYRAKDERLGRDVAVKVLPASLASDSDRLRRFEQEARVVGALNHPNLLAIYDVGRLDGAPYLVAELLEGETLRDKIGESPLGQRKAVEHAIQIARGLAAAHEKGIVHRDLKPENIFVLRDGRVKILDFGLAKLVRPETGGSTLQTLGDDRTTPGQVLGTVGYMSPEQVRGQAADHRSDIFSFGAIFYEMLSGTRAFKRDSGAETMTAILREDPPELTESRRNLSPALDRVVRHCLEKVPEQRFQSASDIAFDLELISGSSTSSSQVTALQGVRQGRPRWSVIAAAVGAVLALAAIPAAYTVGHRSARVLAPSFRQLTFERGSLASARFAPDGQGILYSAQWSGAPTPQVFTTRVDSLTARPLELNNMTVLGTSAKGEMVVVRDADSSNPPIGMLARLPLTGGAPRDVLEGVVDAGYGPDGESLAAIVRTNEEYRLDFPIGHTIYRTANSAMTDVHVGRDGKHLAFFDHPTPGDTRGFVAAVDLAGRKTRLTGEWADLTGLAWSSDGREIWFTGSDHGINSALYGVDLSGRQRDLLHIPGRLRVLDVSRDGRVLLTNETVNQLAFGRAAGAAQETDLTWFDWTLPRAISHDGQNVVLEEDGEGGGPEYSVFLRKMDGSPAIRLGPGGGGGISPDGRWVISRPVAQPAPLILLPTGAGQPKALAGDSIKHLEYGDFTPDGMSVVFVGSEGDKPPRTYIQPLDGAARAVGPDDFRGRAICPDGKTLFGIRGNRSVVRVDLDNGGESRPLTLLDPKDRVISCGRSGLILAQNEPQSMRLYRTDLDGNHRTLIRELAPVDRSGLAGVGPVRVGADGEAYAYGVARVLSALYLVDGLR